MKSILRVSLAISATLLAIGVAAYFASRIPDTIVESALSDPSEPPHPAERSANLSPKFEFERGTLEVALHPNVITEPPASNRTSVSPNAAIPQKKDHLRAALNAAAHIGDLGSRNQAIAQVCYQWAEFDPRGAVMLACDFRLQDMGALTNLAHQWAISDLRGARAWIGAQPPGELKGQLAARIGYLWSRTEPENAANYVLDEIPPGESQVEAVISVLHQWAESDRRGAIAWAQAFPQGPLRERAMREAFLER